MSDIGKIGGRPDPQVIFERCQDDHGNLDVDAFADLIAEKAGRRPDTAEVLARLDADGNGRVSQAEFVTGPKGAPLGPPPGAGNHRRAPDPAALLEGLTDEHGHIDVEALAARISERTGRDISAEDVRAMLDADGSGTVTFDELVARRPVPPAELPADQAGTSDADEELAARLHELRFQRPL